MKNSLVATALIFLSTTLPHIATAEDWPVRRDRLREHYSFSDRNPFIASIRNVFRTPRDSSKFQRLRASTQWGQYPANCLLQTKTADFLVMLPGIGSSQHGNRNRAQAEDYYLRGMSVCILSNSFQIDYYANYKLIPGDLKSEAKLFWQASRSLIIQLRDRIKRVHFVAESYGTHVLKEILPIAEENWPYLQQNYFRQNQIELGRAIFFAPPYSFLNSMSRLDDLVVEFQKQCGGRESFGTLKLGLITFDLFLYMKNRNRTLKYHSSCYSYIILRLGFFTSINNVAEAIAKTRTGIGLSRFISFRDYLDKFYHRYGPTATYSPTFTTGWDQIKTPSLVIFSNDDFINSREDIEQLGKIEENFNNVRVLSLNAGGHSGFQGRRDIVDLSIAFLKLQFQPSDALIAY